MEEREKLYIYIDKRDWSRGATFYTATSYSKHRYVDRLTKKQQNAINFLRMMEQDEVIPGVGCKIQGYANKKLAMGMGTVRKPVLVYVLNC